MNEDGSTKEDLKLSIEEDFQEMTDKLKAAFGSGKDLLVTVIGAMGLEKLVSFRENNQNWVIERFCNLYEISRCFWSSLCNSWS